MKRINTIIVFVIIGLLVTSIGALAGWYVVLRMRGDTISFQDAARGFGFGSPQAGQNGSNAQNIGVGGGGGGFSVGTDGTSFSGSSGAGGIGTGAGANGSISTITGAAGSTSTASSVGTSTTLGEVIIPKTPRLWRVTKTPAAGYRFATSSPAVFFAERATGYIFRADVISGEILRRTNTLIPKIYEAFLGRDGAAIERTINENTNALQTFSGAIGSSTSANLGTLVGANLRNNIMTMDANPDSKIIFYLMSDAGGFSGYTMGWPATKTSQEKKVFSSSIASWKLFALTDGRLIISEKAEDGAAGFAYEVGANGDLIGIVRNAPGLTVLPIAGSKALIYGTSVNGALSLFAQTGTTTLSLPLKTVADKCVWAPYTPASGKKSASDLIVYCAVPDSISAKNFLEGWYMGMIHTSDSWWRINLTTRKTEEVASVGDGQGPDVVDPIIDPSGRFLAFKNGNDDSLWVLRILK